VYSSLLFRLLLKKMEMVWNSSMKSFRLALSRLHIPMDYGGFHCFAFVRVIYSFERKYSCNNNTLFVIFGITVNT
jgi:hypothetical protein